MLAQGAMLVGRRYPKNRMRNVSFSLEGYSDVLRFVEWLAVYFDNLYYDTGIEDEGIIRSNYREGARLLFGEIFDQITQSINA